MDENGVISEEAEKSIKFYISSRQLGLSKEESVKIYDKWAETYDKECPLVGYNGPQHMASAVSDYYPADQRETLKILDVAAGTGLVGRELALAGFKCIDAIEPSDGMLKHLLELKVYGEIFKDTVELNRPTPIPTDTYDCVTIAGGLGNGHIPVEGLDEMIRLVKPGGTIFIVMLEEHLWSELACDGKLEPYMEQLETKLCWKRIRRTVVDNYTWREPGIIFGFEVTKNRQAIIN